MSGRVRSLGISASLPRGFEARVFRRAQSDGARAYAVAQFATIPLPPVSAVGDFGAGIVQHLGDSDILAVLFEYGPESVGERLFSRQGMPREIPADRFQLYRLRRGVLGQAGTQCFFTEAGRPFTLYVVIGSYSRRAALVPRVSSLLAGISIESLVSTPGQKGPGR